ncbi:hypothetical protein [Deinococcus sp.]
MYRLAVLMLALVWGQNGVAGPLNHAAKAGAVQAHPTLLAEEPTRPRSG